MRILLVGDNYYPFIGGVEVHLRQLGQEMAKTNSVAVAAGNFHNGTLPQKLSLLERNLLVKPFESHPDGDVFVHALMPSPTERLQLLPIALRAAPRLQRHYYHALYRYGYSAYRRVYVPKLLELARNADVIHSVAHGYIGWAAQEAARQAGIPFVVTPFVHPHQWGDGPHDIAYYERADAVIGLADTDRDYLCSIGVPCHKTHVIGLMPDLPGTSDPDGFRAKHNLGDNPVILYLGRMMPQKGASSLLAAAPLVFEKHPDARFVFVGPASPDEAVQFENLDERILYLGSMNKDQKADPMSACDIFCMPSMSEIQPIVYLEAWSFGKPVVAGMAHGLPEFVSGQDAGRNVPQDARVIAETLIELLDNPAERRRLGANGQKIVETKHLPSIVAGKLLALYADCIQEKQRTVPAAE